MRESFDIEAQRVIACCFPELTEGQRATALQAFLAYIDLVNDVDDTLQAKSYNDAAYELTDGITRATVKAGNVETH